MPKIMTTDFEEERRIIALEKADLAKLDVKLVLKMASRNRAKLFAVALAVGASISLATYSLLRAQPADAGFLLVVWLWAFLGMTIPYALVAPTSGQRSFVALLALVASVFVVWLIASGKLDYDSTCDGGAEKCTRQGFTQIYQSGG